MKKTMQPTSTFDPFVDESLATPMTDMLILESSKLIESAAGCQPVLRPEAGL